MKNSILVVDDNDVNLELLVQLIGQYSAKHDFPINVLTASNGKEAVELCEEHTIDIIFMDLMMPVMSGAEATKLIKAKYPKTMIIVVSAHGDESKQKEMLLNGAEDYIVKPVNGPLFKSRLHNYLQLVHTRNHIKNRAKAQNLFTSKVYNYNMNFTIASENDLSEFWEAILIRLGFEQHIDNVSDFVRFIYRLGMLQVHQEFQFSVIVEENVDHFYFTLHNIQLIGCEQVDALIQNHYSQAVYKCDKNLLTFELTKRPLEDIPLTPTNVQEAVSAEIVPEEIAILETDENEELMTFDILDAEELSDFEEHLLRLRSIILLMENGSIESSDIIELCQCFDEMRSILSISNSLYVLSGALSALSASISENQEHFQENSRQLYEFVNAFVNDLIFWKTKIFYDGAPSVDFLNDSITTNANMLSALLQPEEDQADEDLGDIFDF